MTPHPRPWPSQVRIEFVQKRCRNNISIQHQIAIFTHTGADIGRAVSRNTHSFFLLDVLDRLGGKGVGKKKQTRKTRAKDARIQIPISTPTVRCGPKATGLEAREGDFRDGNRFLSTHVGVVLSHLMECNFFLSPATSVFLCCARFLLRVERQRGMKTRRDRTVPGRARGLIDHFLDLLI